MNKLLIIISFILIAGNISSQTVLSPTADGYVFPGGSNADKNFGTSEYLQTRFSFDTSNNRYSCVRFDLSGQGNYFSSAKFFIYGSATKEKQVDVFSAFGDWTDTSLKGSANGKPSRIHFLGTIQLGTSGQYYEVDITPYLNKIRSQGKNDITFIMMDRTKDTMTEIALFHSKENTSGKVPYLELTEQTGSFSHQPATYYVDAENGNDNADGKSAASAWETLEKVESVFLFSGDKVLFKRGSAFKGSLFLKTCSFSDDIIEIDAYGDGDKPIIDAEGNETFSLMVFNTPYIEIRNLHITQTASNIPVIRRGLYYQAEDMGSVNHVKIDGVDFKNIVGNKGADDGDLRAKRSAGLSVEVTGNNTPTYLDSYHVENCHFYRVGRHGAVNQSVWSERTLTDNKNWTPNLNVIIRNNVFEETISDGLIVRVSKAPLIEHNLFKRCSTELSGNACFSYNCDDALWQFNEACYTVYNTGDVDAAGFDSDYMSKNTVFQFNYAHHNEYGDMLITGGPSNYGGFNDGTIIRYNVFYNNGHHGIRLSGQATNAHIYNNISYRDNDVVPTEPYDEYTSYRMFWHKNWGGWPKNTTYTNNIYYYNIDDKSAATELNTSSSTGTVHDNNIIYANRIRSYPKEDNGLRLDPMIDFPAAETDWEGLEKMLHFQLKEGSPAINSGINIPNTVAADYNNTPVPQQGVTDRGAFEYKSSSSLHASKKEGAWFQVHCNVLKNTDSLKYSSFGTGTLRLSVYDLRGTLLFTEVKSPNDNEDMLNIAGLEKGTYILKAEKDKLEKTEIFLVLN